MDTSTDRRTSPLFLLVCALVGWGLVQVYSSSSIYSFENFGDGFYFFKKQSLFAVVALVALWVTSRIPLGLLQTWGWVLWPVTVFALTLTLIPGLGVKVGGAHRWLDLAFGFRIEPSEFLKVTLPLFLASLFGLRNSTLRYLPWPLMVLMGLAPLAVLLKQPDFGSFVILLLVSFSVLFVMGLRWRYVISLFAVGLPVFYFLVVNEPYRRARVLAFLDPWSDPEQKGFQVIQSMMSFSQGGLTGAGLGQGQGKLFFLPEAHTDFTLAVLGEELGFLGILVLFVIYGLVVLNGVRIGAKAKDPFQRVLALGLSFAFASNVVVNAGVVLGLLPTKGLTLPFLSYGGSSLVAMSILCGLLINLERQQQRWSHR